MAYILNPIIHRIGYTLRWNDLWFSKRIYYPIVLHTLLNVRALVVYISSKKSIELGGLYFSHMKLATKNDKLLISIFFYDSIKLDMFKFTKLTRHLVLTKKAKWGIFNRKVWFRKRWLKRKYKDKKDYGAQRFFLFLNVLGLDMESIILDNTNLVRNFRIGNKLDGLRSKYPKRYWIAQEEYLVLKLIHSWLAKDPDYSWIHDESSGMYRRLRFLAFLMTQLKYGPFYFYQQKSKLFNWSFVGVRKAGLLKSLLNPSIHFLT